MKYKAIILLVVLALFVAVSSTPIQTSAYENLPELESFEYTDGGDAEITTLDLARPLEIHEDDLLVVIVISDDSAASPFFNDVVNWTKLGEGGGVLCQSKIAVYYRFATHIGGHEMTVTSNSADNMLGWYLVVHGVDTLNPINAFNFDESTATGTNPHIIPSITTLNANALILYGLAFDGGDGYPMNVADPFTELSDRTNTAVPNSAYVSGSFGYYNKISSGATENALVYTDVLDGASYFQLAISGNNDIVTTTPIGEGLFYELFLSLEMWGYFGPLALVVAGFVITKKEKGLGIFFIIVDSLVIAHYLTLVSATPEYWWNAIILIFGVITCTIQLISK